MNEIKLTDKEAQLIEESLTLKIIQARQGKIILPKAKLEAYEQIIKKLV